MGVLIKQKGSAIYFAICMSVFLFVSYSQSEQNDFIDIPHIETGILPLYIVLFVMSSFIFFLINDKESRVDIVALLLFVRLGIHFLPPVYLGFPGHFSVHFATSVVCLCSYMIARNFSKSVQSSIDSFKTIFFILASQIVIECLVSPESFWGNAYLFKVDMALPIGASNALAAKIVPLFALLFVYFEKRKIKWLYFCAAVFTVILTKSRGGMADLLLAFLVVSVWNGFFSLDLFFKSGLMTVILVGVSLYVLQSTDIGKILFSDSDSTVIERYSLWQNGLELIKQHPLTGNGFYYGELANNPHNFALDLMMRSGIVGAILFCAFVVVVVCQVKNNLKDPFVRGCFVAVLCMFWQGFVEIVLFGYIQDLLMWVIIGCMIARSKSLDEHNLVLQVKL